MKAHKIATALLDSDAVISNLTENSLEETALNESYPAFYKLAFGKKAKSPETLEKISSDPEYAYYYARDVLDGKRFQQGEPAILTSPEYAFYYARDIIEDVWKDAEPTIQQHPKWAYYYALCLFKGKRWPEAEPYIMKDPQWAYYYVRDILHGAPWPEAEENIKKDPQYWKYYLIITNQSNK